MKVYILDQGCGDEGTVLGVYSSKKSAEAALREYLGNTTHLLCEINTKRWSIADCGIEEYEVEE